MVDGKRMDPSASPARSEPFIVRAATGSDIAGIIRVNELSDRATGSAESYREAMSDPLRLVVVAECGGDLAGWGKTHFWPYTDGLAPAGHYLGGLTVLPSCRRQGIGTLLTRERLAWIWERSEDAWYVVNTCNLASIEMHRAGGFAPVATGRAFHTTKFRDGPGFLMHARRSIECTNH